MTESTDNVKPLKQSTQTSTTDEAEGDCRGLDRGWSWVVMVASFGWFCLMGGMMYAVGIIHSILLERYQASVSITSWAGALHSALISAGGPLSSLVIDRISCRMALVLSGICYVIGYFCTAFAPNIGVAIVTCGVIAGTGGALGYTACMVVVGFNFRRYHHIANGFSLSGVGVGMFAMAPVMQISRDYYGTSGFFIVLAAVSANMVTFGTLCFPSDLEHSAKRKRKLEKLKRTEKSSSCPGLRGYLNVALNKPVLCLCLCMFNYCLGTFVIYLHLPTYVESKGFAPMQASYFVSISGIASVVGRFLTGLIANLNTLPDISLYAGSMCIVAIATLLYPLYIATFTGNIVYSLILGLFFGSPYVLMTNIAVNYIGFHYVAAAVGLQFFFGGCGSLIGPVLAGLLVDSGGSYDQSFIVAGVCIMLASILGVASHCFYKHSSQASSGLAAMDTYIDVKGPFNDDMSVLFVAEKPAQNGNNIEADI